MNPFARSIFLSACILSATACQVHSSDCHDTDAACNWLQLYFLHNPGTDATTPLNVLVDSGQTSCASGASGDMVRMACPQSVVGQDGDYIAPNALQLRVSDSGFTITEDVSGIVWQRCAKGQSGTGCTGVASSTDTQSQAEAYCASLTLADRSWRLPSMRELMTHPDFERGNPVVDDNDVNNYYPNSPGNASADFFWSSTAQQVVPGNYFTLDMRDGVTGSDVMSSALFVRCVSGSELLEPVYTNQNDGTVYDARSNLLWTRCTMDNTGTGTLLDHTANCSGTAGSRQWVNAIADCEGLSLAGRNDWRLPGIRELNSIVAYDSSASPYVDSTVFPNTPGIEHWTSTTGPLNVAGALAVNFSDGMVTAGNKTLFHRVRCVATGL